MPESSKEMTIHEIHSDQGHHARGTRRDREKSPVGQLRRGMNRGGGRIETLYQPYIDGKKEIAEINEEYTAPFVK